MSTTDPLRVLLVGPAPASAKSRGGMATVMRLMADHPDPRFRVRVVTTYVDGNAAQRAVVGLAGMLKSAWLLLRHDADLLHVHLAHGGSVMRKSVPLFAARIAHIPAVVHGHSFDFAGWYDGLHPAARRLVRALLPADRWLVLGHDLAEQYARCLELPAGTVTVLYNPVALPETTPLRPQEPTRIVSLGRLGRRKGSYDLIAALALLPAPARQHIRVVMAGDGEVADVRTAVCAAGLTGVVDVRGWVGPQERDELLDESHIFVLPSYDEGLPMALLEAMARELAPIVTPVGSIPEVIAEGVSGMIVPAGDPASLAHAITRLVAAPALRSSLAKAARRRAEEFEVANWYRELAELWTTLSE